MNTMHMKEGERGEIYEDDKEEGNASLLVIFL